MASKRRKLAPEELEAKEELPEVSAKSTPISLAKEIANHAPWFTMPDSRQILGSWSKKISDKKGSWSFQSKYDTWDRDNSFFARLESYMPSLCAPIAEESESESEVTAGTGAAVSALSHSGPCRVLGQGTFGTVVVVAPGVAMKVADVRWHQHINHVKREATILWALTQYTKHTGNKIGPAFYAACVFPPSARLPFGRLVIFFEELQGVTITRFLSNTYRYIDHIPDKVALLSDLPSEPLKATFVLEIEKGLQRYMTICKELGLWHLDLKSANMILFIEKTGINLNFRYVYAIDFGSAGFEGDRYNTAAHAYSPYTSADYQAKKGNANAVALVGTLQRTSSSALRIGSAFDEYSVNKIQLDIWYAISALGRGNEFYEEFKRLATEKRVHIEAFQEVVEKAKARAQQVAAARKGGTRKHKRKSKRTRKHKKHTTRYN